MGLPKRLCAKLTHGRSILFSMNGVPVRLRKGMPPAEMPREVYMRYSYKLELTDEARAELSQATQRELVHQTTQMAAEKTEVRSPPLWDLKTPPEEWLELHGDRTDLSPKMKVRLDLARTLVNGT